MVLRRDQRFTYDEAKTAQKIALEQANRLQIERKIRYLLANGNSRYTDQYKQMALPGSGMVLFADFTGVKDFETKVVHVESGNLVYYSQKKGDVIERFRDGRWVQDLLYEYDWLEWQVDNPKAADIVNRFGVIDDG